MSCKKCKQLEDEELAVHLWETHGLSDYEGIIGYQNEDKIKELKDTHKETGHKSAWRFKR